ncbi:polysaccharide deacetylase family protein [uncultured Clostridium sp.]|uniref:polysaccharide deacetylase family protein n=1 Tax=uncultured Clostridium sp. TaxID=59620 RepID=UPI0025907289|nr:polysaccharide deacetylase family protein [uncultured Clostridium sp.]MDU1348407.1 polysaccharide deacetylase family protein [Clostridium argentinense]
MKTKKNFFTLLIITVIAFLSVTGFYLKDKTSAEDIHTSINEDEKICIDKEDTLESKNDDIKSNKFEGLSLKDNSVGVPILYYHSIQKNGENELMMNPELFRSQMQWLKDNNYTSLTLEELYNYIKFNTPVPEKSVVITLDDGYVDNYTNAMPIINEFDFDATIFMVSDFINNPNFLTENQLKELEKNKITIESHTVNHLNLANISREKQKEELEESKKHLGSLLNKSVDYIAYPYGSYTDDTKDIAVETGYKMGFSTNSGWASGNSDLFSIPRVYMSDFYDMNEFIRRMTTPEYNKH